MAEPILLIEDNDGVRILTFNRPDKRNALDSELTFALVEAIEKAEAEESVCAVIMTGEGPAFSAGADMREFRDREDDTASLSKARSAAFRKLLRMIGEMRLPVVAAVNGFALGGGCALAFACDMVLAAESASFGYPEIRHGFTAAGVVPDLVRQVGRKTAFEMIMTGRAFSPEETLRLGVINRVLPDDKLAEEALALGRLFAGYDENALQRMKRILHEVADLPVADGIARVDGLKEQD